MSAAKASASIPAQRTWTLVTSGSQDDSPWYEAQACAVAALTRFAGLQLEGALEGTPWPTRVAMAPGTSSPCRRRRSSMRATDKQIRSSRSRQRVGFEKSRHFAQGRILGRRPEQAQLPGESPSAPDRLGDAFVKPPGQRATARARRERQVDDLMTHDGLE